MEQKQNKMGTMPINRLLVGMSLPIMASMLIQALYNIVDSIFVARLDAGTGGSLALTSVSLAFPVQMLMIAVATGTGVGINALLSRRLGEGHRNEASLVAVNGIFLAVLSSLAFALFGLFGVGGFFRIFTSDPELLQKGISYTSICSIFSFGLFLSITGERIIQATGNTFYSMVSQMAGAITNIILDPLFIFGLLGFPRLEVAGAAVATVIGQMVSMVLNLYFNHKKNHEISISMKGFRPSRRIVLDIYRVGLPSIIMQAVGSVMTFGMNKILILFSATAVTVFGIYFKLQSFIFMPMFGLVNGMIPIVSFNYGAKHRRRITGTIKLALTLGLCLMGVGTLLFQLLPEWALLTLFDASPELLATGVPALRLISIGFLPAAIGIVLSCVFQALGNGIYSLIVSFCRQMLIILPAAYLLGRFAGLDAVWLAFPIAEGFALVLSLLMYRSLHRRLIQPLPLQED